MSHRDIKQSVKKKDRYPQANDHIVARPVSVRAYISARPSPRYSEASASRCSGGPAGRTRSSRCSAEGSPHQAAGRQESKRRAKSHGCHLAGTLRTTATRGCSMDGCGGAAAARVLLGVVVGGDAV